MLPPDGLKYFMMRSGYSRVSIVAPAGSAFDCNNVLFSNSPIPASTSLCLPRESVECGDWVSAPGPCVSSRTISSSEVIVLVSKSMKPARSRQDAKTNKIRPLTLFLTSMSWSDPNTRAFDPSTTGPQVSGYHVCGKTAANAASNERRILLPCVPFPLANPVIQGGSLLRCAGDDQISPSKYRLILASKATKIHGSGHAGGRVCGAVTARRAWQNRANFA